MERSSTSHRQKKYIQYIPSGHDMGFRRDYPANTWGLGSSNATLKTHGVNVITIIPGFLLVVCISIVVVERGFQTRPTVVVDGSPSCIFLFFCAVPLYQVYRVSSYIILIGVGVSVDVGVGFTRPWSAYRIM